jgi:hypothetical protein
MQKINQKSRLKAIIDSQPDDATYDEILREIVFERMIEKGLNDSKKQHRISNEEMEHRIKTW